MNPDHAEHRQFLNKYYGISRWFYDLTRKYYLFGRDTALEQLCLEDWNCLIEMGPGTGRNLRKLRTKKPHALLGGVEASDAMLEYAQKRCERVALMPGFAEDAQYHDLLPQAPDRILFSYCLSMVQDKRQAIENARDHLAPGGQVVIVDFADLRKIPGSLGTGLRTWLETFHVQPLDESLLREYTNDLSYGPGRYYVIARIHAHTRSPQSSVAEEE